MKGLYLADYFPGSGLGHVARYTAYSDLLSSIDLKLATQQKCENFIYSQIIIPSNTKEFVRMISEFDFIICDSFRLDEEAFRILEDKAEKIIFIDDFMRRKFSRGLVIDGTIGCEHRRSPTGEKSLFGIEYAVVRKEFYNKSFYSKTSDIPLLCTFGGQDPKDYLSKLYQYMPDGTIFVGTALYPSHEKFKKNKDIIWDPEVSTLVTTFSRSQYILSTAGQTLYELATLNKQFCSLAFTDNHVEDSIGFVPYGRRSIKDDGDLEELISKISTVLLTKREEHVSMFDLDCKKLKNAILEYLTL
jgi:UDP-2,4-diacetamido-2,4,6-trideoxy-beta-L-altropyranose hydrolase